MKGAGFLILLPLFRRKGMETGKGYETVLSGIDSTIEQLISTLECLGMETTGDGESGSRAQTVLRGVSSKAKGLSTGIDLACKNLFDDVEREIEQVNFSTIYGLADGLSGYGVFDKETEKLEKDLTYTTTRGYFYASLKGIESGQFLSYIVEDVVSSLNEICQRYQEDYEAYEPPLTEPANTSGETTEKSKLEYFWDENLESFRGEIEPLGGSFGGVGADFQMFLELVNEYKKLGTDTLQILSCAANFFNEKQSVGCEGGYSMEGVHLLSGETYGKYSEKLGSVYGIWSRLRTFQPDPEKNDAFTLSTVKQNYFNSEILQGLDFFNRAKGIRDRFLNFVRKYELI